MWKFYRKRFIPSHILILIICAAVYFIGKEPLNRIFFLFLIMQFFNVIGALWAARLVEKIKEADEADRIPLKERK